tara:strand:+ start:173 stop:685 length:513 start_codon:yes stop_codon:yes gene_type:complete
MGYQLIEHIEVGAGGAASIEFTGIPQDGVSLVLTLSGRSPRAIDTTAITMTFNNSTTFDYTKRVLYGNGSGVSSTTQTVTSYVILPNMNAATSTGSTFSSREIHIPNYTSSIAKSFSMNSVSENNATSAYQNLLAGSWAGTAAITSIQIATFGYNFAQYSTASLYKITAD